ncbi:MAG: hypothetical protein RLZZ528_2065, partial [Pseudomonadota bacterium]
MRSLLALTILIWPMCVAAEGYSTDAFGLFRGAPAGDRAGWSGLRERPGEPGRGQVEIAPGPAESVAFLLGAKSLVAGGDMAQAVAVATDSLGNLVADGTRASFVHHAGRVVTVTRGGLAAVDIAPGSRAGLFLAGVEVAGRQGPRAEYVVQADHASASPVLQPLQADALPETFAEVASAPILDRFGNPLEDGLGLSLVIAHSGGQASLASAATIAGQARATLLLRDFPAQGNARLWIAGATSAEVPFTVRALRPLGPLEVRAEPLPEIGATHFVIGPLLTDAGFLLADGAPVGLSIRTSGGQALDFNGWVRDGKMAAVLPVTAAEGPFRVVVDSPLGVQ